VTNIIDNVLSIRLSYKT